MKALLGKLSRHRAIGLYLDDQEVAFSLASATPLGPVEITRHRETYEPEKLVEVLERLFKPYVDRRKRCRIPVAIGLPALRVFFSTRPIKTLKGDVSPQVLLHEALQSPNVTVDDMVVELVKSQPSKRPVASIVSCRKKYLAGILAALEVCGVRASLAEPVPCALLRTGSRLPRKLSKAKVVQRIFVGAGQGLAVVTANQLPIVWRNFDVPQGGEDAAIRSVTRALQGLLKYCGVDAPLDVVLVQGDESLREKLEAERFKAEMEVPVACLPGPGLRGDNAAYGLAIGGLATTMEGFNLARSLKPPPTLWDIFPLKELCAEAILVACMAVFLFVCSLDLQDSLRSAQVQNAQRPWVVGMSLDQLKQEKTELEKKVNALAGFLGTRIPWSSYTSELPARMPPQISLVSLQGISEMPKKGPAAPKKSLLLRASVPILQDGQMPREIDDFVNALRDEPLLKRDLPQIDLADIKSMRNEKQSQASFVILCTPKAAMPAPKPPPGGKPGGH